MKRTDGKGRELRKGEGKCGRGQREMDSFAL